jgi:hypothetical protein
LDFKSNGFIWIAGLQRFVQRRWAARARSNVFPEARGVIEPKDDLVTARHCFMLFDKSPKTGPLIVVMVDVGQQCARSIGLDGYGVRPCDVFIMGDHTIGRMNGCGLCVGVSDLWDGDGLISMLGEFRLELCDSGISLDVATMSACSSWPVPKSVLHHLPGHFVDPPVLKGERGRTSGICQTHRPRDGLVEGYLLCGIDSDMRRRFQLRGGSPMADVHDVIGLKGLNAFLYPLKPSQCLRCL